VADGFVALAAAWRAARRTSDSSALTVTAGPAFTAKWLAPRLFAFASAHPEIELRFSASLRLMDFDRDDVDVAIRFGLPRDEPGLSSHVLTREWVAPMMSPELAHAYPDPADLAGAPLLHQDDITFLKPAIDWSAWFRAAGLEPRLPAGARFSQADHAIDAATAGGGVVLGRISLAERDLREGRLVVPYDIGLTTEAVYRVVYPAGAETRPQVRTFIDWLEQEVKGLDAYSDGMRFIPAAQVAV
jgi:LysR family glycine cleavage system transcriptional activator